MRPAAETRSAELAGNLAVVRARIAAACAAVGRDERELTLVAVTKTYPAADVLALVGLGLRDFGENRDQEASPKAAALAAETEAVPVTWHFIGQLQTNKAHSVARYANVVQSVDRVRLVRALGAAARAAGRDLTCLVQVSLDTAGVDGPDPGKPHPGKPHPGKPHPGKPHPGDPNAGGIGPRGGVPPAGLTEVAAAIEAEERLILGGLMAVAPRGAPPDAAFASLRKLSATVREVRASATAISAGMSGDLEAAIANGATHLRIGTALLGNRSLPVL